MEMCRDAFRRKVDIEIARQREILSQENEITEITECDRCNDGSCVFCQAFNNPPTGDKTMRHYDRIQQTKKNAGSNIKAAQQGKDPQAVFSLRSDYLWDRPMSVEQKRRRDMADIVVAEVQLSLTERLSDERAEKIRRIYVFGGQLQPEEYAAVERVEQRAGESN